MTNVEEGMAGQHRNPSPNPSMSTSDQHTDLTINSCCNRSCNWSSPSLVRYVYGFIFFVTNLLAWLVRDYGQAALSELQRLQGCQGTEDCLGTEGVLRISLGCFVFFFIMFLSTAGTKKLTDPRNSWHSSWWVTKIVLWIACMTIPFLAPSELILLYGQIAHLGAGIFLFIQLISIISLIRWLDNCCRTGKNAERCRLPVLVISIAAFVASFLGIILMYIWYAPRTSCTLNLFFITLTLALLQLIIFVSNHSKVKAGFLSPGLVGVYIVFLCWCAIRSEPLSESCNKKAEAATNADWVTIISFVIALLVIVVATFTTGIDSRCFQFKKVEVESEDDVPYRYGFFHFVFAMGATYFAMLFIGWNTHHTMRKWTIDVGWASTWVRIVNEWLAAVVYIWMLIAPVFWTNRTPFQTS